jgi:NAD(P)-dependent dehydrogenase (short-subunit alcohol dehydrogenase family)
VTSSPYAALVTGGTGRVGSAIAARLAAEGFRVKAAGRRDGDLSRAADARVLVERAAAELGGLDLLVNAASAGFEPKLSRAGFVTGASIVVDGGRLLAR